MLSQNRFNVKNKNSRCLVIITGYYGFDNLGDEAILEEILHEVCSVWDENNVIVLSNDPTKTETMYGVKSANRWHWAEYVKLFSRAALLISGGGGLFQDRKGTKSTIFYAAQIMAAKLFGTKVLIYAQGLGPLKTKPGQAITKLAFKNADSITVRDQESLKLLSAWNIKAKQTADPVWLLEKSPIPEDIGLTIDDLKKENTKIIGVSLREDPLLKKHHLEFLAQGIAETYPGSAVLLLPLQEKQDSRLLEELGILLEAKQIKTLSIDTSSISLPSGWLSLIEKLDLVIGMRLHALLMAIRLSKPVIGIAYDPKVSILLSEFSQTQLLLTDENAEEVKQQWSEIFCKAQSLGFSQTAKEKVHRMQESAQKNALELKTILRGYH